MIRKLEGVLLSTDNTKRLAKFYREVVGLKQSGEYEMGEDGKSMFDFSKYNLYINPHSGVHGKNKMPQRHILNFEVDNIEKEVKKLKKSKVKQIQDIYHIEGYGHVSTFEDPDGNYFQLVQVRASN